MRVLVTGGAGFIGRAVINELIPTADRIVALDSLRADVHATTARLPADVWPRLISSS